MTLRAGRAATPGPVKTLRPVAIRRRTFPAQGRLSRILPITQGRFSRTALKAKTGGHLLGRGWRDRLVSLSRWDRDGRTVLAAGRAPRYSPPVTSSTCPET